MSWLLQQWPSWLRVYCDLKLHHSDVQRRTPSLNSTGGDKSRDLMTFSDIQVVTKSEHFLSVNSLAVHTIIKLIFWLAAKFSAMTDSDPVWTWAKKFFLLKPRRNKTLSLVYNSEWLWLSLSTLVKYLLFCPLVVTGVSAALNDLSMRNTSALFSLGHLFWCFIRCTDVMHLLVWHLSHVQICISP